MNFDKLQKSTTIIAKNFRMYYYLGEVFQWLQNIPYAIIKGEVLSIQAYGDVGYRNSSDVDILIPRQYLQQMKIILQKAGFEEDIYDLSGNRRDLTRLEKIMLSNSHQTVPYIKILDGKRLVSADINIDLFWGEYTGRRIDILNFLSDTIEMDIYGYHVKALSKLKHFIVLCLHHYREMNAIYHFAMGNSFTEKMFGDVYKLYYNGVRDNIDELSQFVFAYNLEKVFYYILYYTSIVFQDTQMKNVCELFKTSEGVEGLNCYGLNDIERKLWPIPFEERMNHPNIFNVIKGQLNDDDMYKLKMSLSVFNQFEKYD